MAALGKGIGHSAARRARRRVAVATIGLTAAAAVMMNAPPVMASQDPLFATQWNLQQIDAPAAWARSTGAGVRIGIVDSGVFAGQEDLAGKVVAATDCINTNGDPRACAGSGQDDSGHGTLMAGIAAATKDNGRGIAGVAPDARLVVARVLTNNGGSIVDVEAGIRWVVQHGAQVVNLSVADNPVAQRPLDLSFESAVDWAWAAGAVPVIASGNSNSSLGPGQENFSNLNALVVGATDSRGQVVPYVNHLSTTKWGVLAPGGSGTGDQRDIMSTWRNPSTPNATNLYALRGGASVSAAHVSGVVALLLAEGLSPAQAVQRIVTTARRISCGPDCNGLVDAAAAVGARDLPATVPQTTPPSPAPAVTQPPAPAPAPPSTTAPAADAAPELVVPEPDPAMAVPLPIAGAAATTSLGTHRLDDWGVLGWLAAALLGGAVIRFCLRRRYASEGVS
jgi:serine protease